MDSLPQREASVGEPLIDLKEDLVTSKGITPARFRWLTVSVDVCLLATVLFVLTSYLWNNGYLSINDVLIYNHYALAFWTQSPLFQHMPHEYPPLSLLVFLLSISPGKILPVYWTFAVWMGLLICLSYLWFAKYISRGKAVAYAGYLFTGAMATVLLRFDLVPALVTLAALVLAERRRYTWAYCMLAAGVLLKLYPVFLLPVLVIDQWQNSSLHGLNLKKVNISRLAPILPGPLLFVLIVVAGFSFSLSSLTYNIGRPIQIESFPAILLWLGSFLGFSVHGEVSFGSVNLTGDLSGLISTVSLILLAAGLIFIYWRFLKSKLSLAQAFLAIIGIVLVFSKTLSPQYLIWIIPLIAYVEGFDILWLGICAMTSLIYPFLYHFYFHIDNQITNPIFLGTIAARNILLLTVMAFVVSGKGAWRCIHNYLSKSSRVFTTELHISFSSYLLLLFTCMALLWGLFLRFNAITGASFDYDEGVYWASLNALSHGAQLYRDIFSSQPPLFLTSLLPGFKSGAFSIEAARLQMIFFSLILITAMFIWSNAWYGRKAALIALILVLLDPLLLSQSHTLEADLPSVAIACTSVAIVAIKPQRWQSAVASGVLFALALQIKLLVLPMFLPLAFLLLYPLPQKALHVQLHWKYLLLSVGAMLITLLICLAPYWVDRQTLWQQVIALHLNAGQAVQSRFPSSWQVLIGTGSEFYMYLLGLLGGILLWWRKDWTRMFFFIIWIAAALSFLLEQKPLLNHHIVLLLPPLILLFTSGMSAALEFCKVPSPVFTASFCLLTVFVSILATFAESPFTLQRLSTVQQSPASQYISAHTSAGQLIVTDDQFLISAAGRNVPTSLVDTSYVRVVGGSLTAKQVEEVISESDVVGVYEATGRLQSIPGLQDWVKQHLPVIISFPGQGTLYLKSRT